MELKSISEHMKRSAKDKRGVMGLSTAQGFLVGLLSLVIIGVLVIIVLNSLNSTSVATDQTTAIVNNASNGLGSFFGNTGTWLTLLSVVVIILIIAAVIVVVNRFGSGSDRVL